MTLKITKGNDMTASANRTPNTGQLCNGMTVPRPASNSRPEEPSRPCRQRAPEGREYCIAHDPDEEYVAERRRQSKLAAAEAGARWQRGRQQQDQEHRQHLERLSR